MRIYTDGSYRRSQDLGGWAWVSEAGYANCGGIAGTTNQQMEMFAVIQALQDHNGYKDLVVVSDSMYVVSCINDQWYKKWRRNKWKTSNNTPVKNIDLWQLMLEAYEELGGKHNVTFEWVKGHSGDRMNELADQLASKAGAGFTSGIQTVNLETKRMKFKRRG